MHGKQAEEDWHKRCRRIAPDLKRKKVGLTTWHANFIHLLHDRCMNCLEYASSTYSQNIGRFLLYGFTFLKLCRDCQGGGYPVHTSLTPITVAQAKEKRKDYEAVLGKVPRFTVVTDPFRQEWLTCILEAAIDQAMILAERKTTVSKY